MLKELGQITDPSLRERLDRGLVSNLIKAKVNLGLGLKSWKKNCKMDRSVRRRITQTCDKKI